MWSCCFINGSRPFAETLKITLIWTGVVIFTNVVIVESIIANSPISYYSFLGHNKLDLRPSSSQAVCVFHLFRKPFTSLEITPMQKRYGQMPTLWSYYYAFSFWKAIFCQEILVSSLLLKRAFLSFPMGLVLSLSVPINVYICISICTVPRSYQKPS